MANNQYCAAIRAAVAVGDTTVNLGAQGAITLLAAGASYPFAVAATKMSGLAVEYMIATADNGSGVLTVTRAQYGSTAQSFVVGDGLLKETPNASTQSFSGSQIFNAAVSRATGPIALRTAAGGNLGKVGGSIFDHFATASTTHTDGTEDDLYSDTTVADTLGVNGDAITAEYVATFVGSATANRRVKAYFGGTVVLDSGSLTFASGGNADIYVTVIRESSTVVRVKAEFVPSGITLQPIVTYTRITGLTLSSTNILKITGIASGTGAASADISAVLGKVQTALSAT